MVATRRVRRLLVWPVTVMALGGLLVASVGTVASQATTNVIIPPFPADVGFLHLHMASDGNYFRSDTGSSAGTVEPIRASNCVVGAPLPQSVAMTASVGVVGVVGDKLGVQAKGEGSGTPCGQVNVVRTGTQALDLKLAGNLAGLTMDRAELDIEGKGSSIVRANMLLNGTLQCSSKLTFTGTDSSPDAGIKDNHRWLLPVDNETDQSNTGTAPTTASTTCTSPVNFNELYLTVDPTGAFSLSGGGDGTPAGPLGRSLGTGTLDSLFEISNVGGTLACGDTVSSGGGTTPSASVTLNGTTGCQSVSYSLQPSNTSTDQTILFQKTPTDANHYTTTIAWLPEPAVNPVPPTQIAYTSGATHAVQWCGGTKAAPTLPPPPPPPDTQEQWCLVEQDTVVAAGGNMQVTETYFGVGDPATTRHY